MDSEGQPFVAARRGERRPSDRGGAGPAGGGGGGLPALVDRQPGARAARRRAARRALAGRALHALAPAQPDHPRVPARLVDCDRRVAEAAHAGVPRDDGARPARRRASRGTSSSRPRSAARGAPTRLSSGRSTRSARAPRMAPVAAVTYAREELQERKGDLIVCDTGGTTFDVGLVSGGEINYDRRDVARRALDRPHHGHPLGRRQVDRRRRRLDRLDRPRRPAARRPAQRRAPTRVRPATGAAALEPTVTDAAVVLGWIDPGFFLGGRLALDAEAARDGDRGARRRAARAERSRRRRRRL